MLYDVYILQGLIYGFLMNISKILKTFFLSMGISSSYINRSLTANPEYTEIIILQSFMVASNVLSAHSVLVPLAAFTYVLDRVVPKIITGNITGNIHDQSLFRHEILPALIIGSCILMNYKLVFLFYMAFSFVLTLEFAASAVLEENTWTPTSMYKTADSSCVDPFLSKILLGVHILEQLLILTILASKCYYLPSSYIFGILIRREYIILNILLGLKVALVNFLNIKMIYTEEDTRKKVSLSNIWTVFWL